MVKKLLLTFIFCLSVHFIIFGQSKSLDYYLPPTPYDEQITTPQEFLGYQIGDWHISHDQVTAYCQLLARESERVQFREYARSYENRALFALIISSEGNINNLENIQKDHRNATSFNGKLDKDSPLVIYQGYSIHGNESSAANAAILIAYHLAAGKSETVQNLLNNSVILLDPCMNPDGLQRFSTWVNMNKSQTLVSDPADREYSEPWPKGRTNHYWSDLNRDWLLLTHQESQGRVRFFQEWRPHILTDHHEMGKNSGFFFQPGVPERTNPITPQINQTLTEEIGEYHAKALDKLKTYYFTKKRFDDYYYGKGSTYPDLQGCIGILFEQASSRGHYQENKDGILDFPYTIRNQVATSLSTQEAAMAMKDKIKSYKVDDISDIKKIAKREKKTYYTFSRKTYREKADYLANILDTHAVTLFYDKKNETYIVPLYQRQYRLIKTIFERVHTFPSNEFYDVSTWTLPLAFNLEYNEERFRKASKDWVSYRDVPELEYANFHQSRSAKYHILPWGQWNTTKALNHLLRDSIQVNMYVGASKEFQNFQLNPGDLVLPTTQYTQIKNVLDLNPVDVFPLSESIHPQDLQAMNLPQIAMIVGEGTSSYDAGDIWFQLDTRMHLQLTKIDKYKLLHKNIHRYTHIVLPSGYHSNIDTTTRIRLKEWLNNGGTLIAFGRSIQWIQSENLLKDIKFTQPDDNKKQVEHRIGGAMYEILLPDDSPYIRGYKNDELPLFKKSTWVLNSHQDSNIHYSQNPLLSGYSSAYNQDRIKNSSAIIVQKHGKGKVIGMVDNPLFRGYWLGGTTLFENLIYMQPTL